jgi:hypothetical protein
MWKREDIKRTHVDDELQALQNCTHMTSSLSENTFSNICVSLQRIFDGVQADVKSPENKSGIQSNYAH